MIPAFQDVSDKAKNKVYNAKERARSNAYQAKDKAQEHKGALVGGASGGAVAAGAGAGLYAARKPLGDYGKEKGGEWVGRNIGRAVNGKTVDGKWVPDAEAGKGLNNLQEALKLGRRAYRHKTALKGGLAGAGLLAAGGMVAGGAKVGSKLSNRNG